MKKYGLLFFVISITVLGLLMIFMPNDLLAVPDLLAADALLQKPYINMNVFGLAFVLIVPSSTIMVYLLGIVTMLLGRSFLLHNNSKAGTWWGISMVFWGLGAILAGTSYQGLGYELKCTSGDLCLFTSWFELSYLYFTAVSIGALGIAIGYSTVDRNMNKLIIFEIVSVCIYTSILIIGSVLSNRSLISYELFTIFFMPQFVLFFILNVKRYMVLKDKMNRMLITTWILFLVVNISYFVYLFLGVTEVLYEEYKIWFSANDILHVALLLWMIYLWAKVKPLIEDYKKNDIT